jgi:abhydrolase domain-containing protein 6
MSLSMIVRTILLVCLVAYLVVRHIKRKPQSSKKRLSKTEDRALAERKRKKEWKKQRHAANRKSAKEEKEQKWQKMLLEALPSGLTRSSIMLGDLRVAVMEGGQGPGRPTVLFLHGLASDKEIWSELSHLLLSDGCHVVAPDLPGFGDSTSSTQLQHDVTSQARRIKAFADAKNLRRLHLVGHSVGAAIAAAFACLPKSGVVSLTMIEPIGIRVPEASELDRLIAQGTNPFVFDEAAGYRALLDQICFQMPSIREAIFANRSVKLSKNYELSSSIWRDTREGDGAWVLDLLLSEIPQTTLGIFGANSKVVHAQTRETMTRRMKNAQSVTLDDCGHLPMLEQPEKTASYILRFQRALEAAVV